MSIAAIALTAVPRVFDLVKMLLPSLAVTTNVGLIGSAISLIAEYTPLVVAQYRDLKPIVENAITALRANPNTMPEQIQQLREMARQYDLEWADALAVSRAGDEAAGYEPSGQ